MLPSTPDVRRKPSCVAAKRTSDSGIFVGVSWSVQGRQNFHGAEYRFRSGLSGVTNLIGGKATLALMDVVVLNGIMARQARASRSLRSDGTARCKAQAPMPPFRHCLGS